MDDPLPEDVDVQAALRDLRRINRLLGGRRATDTVLTPVLRAHSSLHILDLGTGTGDIPAHLVRRGRRFDTHIQSTGIDVNPAIIEYGRDWLDASLSPFLRDQVQLDVADALHLPYSDNAFDLTHAALFLHHFHGDEAIQLLREMRRVSRLGVVVNDLHRHRLAYAGIWLFSRLLRMSPMVQHDGPLSVRRGFQRAELRRLAAQSGLSPVQIQWHWAFRWTLSTLGASAPPPDTSRIRDDESGAQQGEQQ